MNTIPDTKNKIKPAAIWARVSTHDQAETSIPTQIAQTQALLERDGYTVNHVLTAEWSSMDLYACPEFRRLYQLVRNHQIEALAVYDRDRLQADSLKRLVFLSELQEAGIKLLVAHGAAIMDGAEGRLIEHALALGKEKQVLRARLGSKDGLHDRVVRDRLPVTRHKVYGYTHTKEDWHEAGKGYRLEPNEDHKNVKLIFDMLLAGKGYQPILDELNRRGIRSPGGQEHWNKTALTAIIRNGIYAGRYYGLKKAAVEPKKRKTDAAGEATSTGNSSTKATPLDEQVYLPEIEIVNPPITWAEREKIIEQIKQHQRFATRNAKRYYLLRGLISCGVHKGKNGAPRLYHGRPHYGRWHYTCPGGSGCPNVDGPIAELFFLGLIGIKTAMLPDELLQGTVDQKNQESAKTTIEAELTDLQRRAKKNTEKLITVETRRLDGEYTEDVYRGIKEQCDRESQYIRARQDELLGRLEALTRTEQAALTVKQLRSEWAGGVFDYFEAMQKIDPKDWPIENLRLVRELLEAIDFRMTVYPVHTKVPNTVVSNLGLGEKPVRYDLSASIVLPPPAETPSIVSAKPGQVQHNARYPLRLTVPVGAGR